MQYHFDTLEDMAAYIEQFASQARASAEKLKKITTGGKGERQRRIASYNSEAYGYEQSANIIRSAKIKGGSVNVDG